MSSGGREKSCRTDGSDVLQAQGTQQRTLQPMLRTVRLRPPAAGPVQIRPGQAHMQAMPRPLLPQRHAGAHPHRHALVRPQNAALPSGGGDQASLEGEGCDEILQVIKSRFGNNIN